MPWKSEPPKIVYAETATLIKDGGINLSAQFIKNHKLEKYDWVEIFFDDDLRRIGFKFHNSQTYKTRRLSKKNGRGEGRGISDRKLNNRKWISDILDDPDVTNRRFFIEIDDSIKEPTDGVRYYISVDYRFQTRRNFGKQGDYPRVAGVYRLFKDKELVRIGESDNLERRLKEHSNTYKDEIDEYDFAEIEDANTRKSEERRLLEEFRDTYGRLPKLNPVAT